MIKQLFDFLKETPYRILLLFPSFILFIIAFIALQKELSIWAWISCCIGGTALFLLCLKRSNKEVPPLLGSGEWLEQIAVKLDDCASANIYLRQFAHPDDFRETHRDALYKIIDTLKKKIEGGADITVVAYHPDAEVKSGLDWLLDNGKEDVCYSDKIDLRTSQPVANSSSVYIFDDRTSYYNKRIPDGNSYHADDFSNSIIHELISRGFTNLAETK